MIAHGLRYVEADVVLLVLKIRHGLRHAHSFGFGLGLGLSGAGAEFLVARREIWPSLILFEGL